ncbi:MAG: FHIPEP family type III secretion protein [Candidatus Gastranaerophilales bacterium]|nr:FHIPEP family type III secretion protein [Candidatus Gastranaerophilales bacterium]
MNKEFRQEFSIKSVPVDDTVLLENTLNAMASSGWELYSIYEAEQNSKIVYNCIFVKEVENTDEQADDDIINFRSQVEKMLYSKEEPYELCLNLQKKIRDKKAKIERIKKFLESSKDTERELLNDEIKKDIDELNDLKRDLKDVLAPYKMSKFLGEEKLSINLSQENYCLCDPQEEKNLLSQTVKVRQELTKELGYIIPKVQFIENTSLDEYDFSINIHGVPIASSKAYPNYIAFFEDELNLEKAPKNAIKTKDPLTKRKMLWIPKQECENYWVEGLEATQYIANYLSYFAIVHVEEIFDYTDLNRYVDFVSEQNSFLVDTILGDYISISELKYLLVQLIRERVSIKDITLIFEKLNDFSDDPNKADLLDRLRIALSRQISDSIANKDKEIFAYELDDETLDLLEKQTSIEESNVKIDLSKFSKFKKILKEIKKDIIEQSAVIVVPQQFRQVIFILVSQLFMDIPVVCYEEINLNYKLNILGKI